ncbi:MAG: cytochrome c biogenesis CcdA family protein [Stappiaceae bacterium]
MEIVLAYLAGLLTLINPCVLPVLPIVLASAVNEDRRAPLVLAAGMSVSFVAFGMAVATLGHSIGLTEDLLTTIGASVMIGFGIVLLIPLVGRRFELATAGISGAAGQRLNDTEMSGLTGQFFGGMLLGIVWSPCIGPTLGGAIALASQGQDLFWAGLIMVAFAMGVSTLIVGLAFGARNTLRSRVLALSGLAEKSKTIMGVVFLTVGILILFRVHHIIEAWAVRTLPYWFQDLSVAL